MAQDHAGHEKVAAAAAAAAAAESCGSRARQRWKAAALKETQRIRVEKLREKQAEGVRQAERKQTLSTQFERELHETLESRSWEAVLLHFGAASYKQVLVQFHPDRAPPGTPFEEIVRREVVFKYVQMRHDRASHASGGVPRGQSDQPRDNESRRRQREEEAKAWRGQQEREAAARAAARKQAAGEEAKRRRNMVPEGAVLRVTGASWPGFGTPPVAGPLGYYAVESHDETHGRPAYRKIPPQLEGRADWAPWAEKAAKEALDASDHMWWHGCCWKLGHREEQRITYMAACGDDRPPTHEWNVVDSRETEPCFTWL
jgi:hypothetical protein